MARKAQKQKAKRAAGGPPDQAVRERIAAELDHTMLVEAAAGTGKTTSMVQRMIALVAEGKCTVDAMAAVTFTRKAAAELRGRFQVALERAAHEARGHARDRLAAAAGRIERCFVGTIHSFCARLLRERPVEAGVDVAFREADDLEDLRLREEAWERHVARLYADEDPILDRLEEAGLSVSQLEATFQQFANHPDVAAWPTAADEAPDLAGVRAALGDEVARIAPLVPTFPRDKGNDELMRHYEDVVRAARVAHLERPGELMDVVGMCRRRKVVQKMWPASKAQGKAEGALWDAFVRGHVEPALALWRAYRYGILLRLLQPAVAAYDALRRAHGLLNYQDLLLKAAALLRDRPNIRGYFRRRFSHLLVDEFQDTDPIQAEVMLLLTADDPAQTDWRRCRPAPGSLFVVGDPKQSIYRFRRADIVTYTAVRDIIRESGGRVLSLSANFRSTPEVIGWVNRVSGNLFPDEADPYAPANVPLQEGRPHGPGGDLAGVYRLPLPATVTRQEEAAAWEADFIARFIRRALDEKAALPRSPREIDDGVPPHALPGDFLILTPYRARLSRYAQALQALGVPHQVSGGSALNEVEEIALLHRCLWALAHPNDPVALVAVLRGALFGVSDADLYAFKKAGGEFAFRAGVPAKLAAKPRALFADAFDRLQRYAAWLDAMPPLAAIERIAADLGLPARAAAAPGGNEQVGSFAKAVEILRAAQADAWSVAGLVDVLGELVEQAEPYDGIAAVPRAEAPVRLMNLHKAKGLEAPVVFLADAAGKSQFAADLHVDRSGRTVRGFLAVYGEPNRFGGRGPLIAHAPDWEQYAAEEARFGAAERNRLLYVAATRPGTALVVSTRRRENPWTFFAPFVEECPELADPGPQRAPRRATVPFQAGEAEKAAEEIAARRARAAAPTYAVAAMKKTALDDHGPVPWASEHGTEWGTVVHTLLEAAMQDARADLATLARAACDEQELPLDYAPQALACVEAVRQSDIWKRARGASGCLTEVPLQVPETRDGLPTMLRGVIDLAFREGEGWVIVDYKTDRAPAGQLKRLTEHYRPQLDTYARAWREATGEKVAETGLFFTHTGRYVTVAP
jgi:ATP-dependent helicase/nuclease subunit A